LIVEEPSYIGFHAAFLAEGARLYGIPVDAGGLRVDHLPEPGVGHEEAPAHLAVVTPSHQYPTGVTLTLERRGGVLGVGGAGGGGGAGVGAAGQGGVGGG